MGCGPPSQHCLGRIRTLIGVLSVVVPVLAADLRYIKTNLPEVEMVFKRWYALLLFDSFNVWYWIINIFELNYCVVVLIISANELNYY